MIPVRDGVHLQTAILTPIDQQGPLPILFRRTPYGVPEKPPEQMPSSLKEFAQDGYIFVIQNLRGRFKSEGVFNLSSWVDLNDPKATNETTDAYDSIDWLLKNVPNNNGKVGMFGVSYDGLTTALTLLHPHPALAAISEQASPVDQWMNDDDHRYGALRESYDFEYAVMEQADKNKNTHFDFETYDTYQWYLDLGPLSNINAKYLHGSIPYWNSTVEHPDYDDFWKKEAWVSQLHASTVPNLNVAGFWDQEDPWGPWQIFRHAEENDPQHTNFIVAGPWYHGEWQSPKGDSIGIIPFGGHETAREFRENIEAPFFRYYLHGQGEKAEMAGQHVSEWIEYLAHLLRLASQRSEAYKTVSAREWNSVVHRARRRQVRASFSRVRFRSRESRALPPASHLAHVSRRRLAHLGSCRPALCRSSSGCSLIPQRTTRPRSDCHRPAGGESLRFDFRHRQRFRRQADRRISTRRAEECLASRGRTEARTIRPISKRLPTAGCDGSAARPLSDQL